MASVLPNSGAKANSQRDVVLQLLRQASSRGIRKDHFLFGTGPLAGRRITQVSARVHELEASGCVIEHLHTSESDFVTFILRAEPGEPAQLRLTIPAPAHARETPITVSGDRWRDPEEASHAR